jgi:two-component system cell cycle sensor histidine kinase/response regulator CckA
MSLTWARGVRTMSKLLIAFGFGIVVIALCCVATLRSLGQLKAIASHLALDPVPGAAAIARIAADFNQYRLIEVSSSGTRDAVLVRKASDITLDLKAYEGTITQGDDRRQFAELIALWASYVDRHGTIAAPRVSEEINAMLSTMIDWNRQEGVRSIGKVDGATRDASATALAMLVATLLLGALAVYLSRTVERPMRALAETAQAVALGNLDIRATVNGPIEVATIARELNHMLDARARADGALRKSEEMLSKVFMSAPVGIAVTSLADGQFYDVNGEAERLLGYSRNELIGRTTSELGLWTDATDRDRIVTGAQVRSELHEEEVRLQAKGRKALTIRYAAQTIQLDGKMMLLSVFADLTERKRAEDALRASEEKFSKVFMSAPVAITVSTLGEGRCLEVNSEFLRVFGYSRDEVVGRTALELGLWPDPAAREAMVTGLLETGTPISREQPLRAKGGEIRTVRAAGHLLEIAGERLLLSAMVDVTDHRLAEAERRYSDQLYRELVDSARDVIFAITPDGVLTALNPAFEEVSGWLRARWIGQPFVGLVLPDDVPKVLAQFQSALMNEPRPFTQVRTLTANGRVRLAEVYLTAQLKDGKIVGALGISRDITERAQLEEQFRQAQKMEAVGRLAGGVAHDFNNVLSVILSYAEMIGGDLKPEEPLRADIEEIRTAALRATDLTRQLLAFSRQQVLEPRVLDLTQSVAGMEKMLRRLLGADIELTMLQATRLWNVKADPGQMEQILMNLAVNARDAMPRGGQLVIETQNVELDDDYARAHHDVRPGSYVMLTVADSGSGIDRDTLGRIFEPFFTTKEKGKGTGLGLSTVFGIVTQSGGHIWVDSEPGKGTTFKVYLPRVVGAVELTPSARPLPPSGRGNETILLVDDDDQVRAVARSILRRSGYVVLEASNGGEALLVCEQHPGRIHLLLTDVVLPRMSGRQIAERVATMRSDTKVLFMSGYTDDAVLQHGLLKSDVAYIQKPITPATLIQKVCQVLLEEVGKGTDPPSNKGVPS